MSGISQPNGPAVFPQKQILTRDWGIEEILVGCEHYTLKRIIMNPHAEGGLQFHHKKDESAYVIRGSALVTYDPGNGSLTSKSIKEGDTVRFPQGAVHRVKAFHLGLEYIEASTPYYNDRCHVEKEYGLEKETGGLPSTRPDEVVRIPKGAGCATSE